MTGYIYGIMNKLNGKWYVGQTTRPYQIRWLEHKEHLQNREHHSYKLQDAFNECGIDAFEWHVLEEVEADAAALAVLLTSREQSWCAKKQGVKEGYNVLAPGKKYVSPEQKKKNREASRKTKHKKKSSKKPPQKKKRVSGKEAESRAKSLSNKWKKFDIHGLYSQ